MTTMTNNFGRTLAMVVGALAVLMAASFLMAAKPAQAATTFTVNSTADVVDFSLNDDLCDITPFVAGKQCTLRAAIEQANATDGADAIEFDLPDDPEVPGPEVKTIKPLSQLPNIADEVTIDGYTQGSVTPDPADDAKPNTLKNGTNARLMVELDGSDVTGGFAPGLQTTSSNTVIKGLVINRFPDPGIRFFPSPGIRIEGNFIGTDPSGTQDLGNGDDGVEIPLISGSDFTVGGASPAARNLISGNEGDGIEFHQLGSGTDRKVVGNLIGTQKDGISSLGNSDSGVNIRDTPGVTVGGSTAASANTIAFNGGDGVNVNAVGSHDNRILRNSIFSNGRLGIDLDFGDVVTPNDPGDADEGPNRLQNKPNVNSAKTSQTETVIKGRLSTRPDQAYVIRFFSNPPNTDEGKKFVGQKQVTTSVDGLNLFTFEPRKAVPAGQTITATATDSEGNTSEFSAPRPVAAQ